VGTGEPLLNAPGSPQRRDRPLPGVAPHMPCVAADSYTGSWVSCKRTWDRWCYAQQHAVRAAQERYKPHVALAVARTAWSNYWELFVEAGEIRARVSGATSSRPTGIPSAPHA